MFERFTETAKRTVYYARFEASEFGSQSIEAEHLLLGLLQAVLKEPGGIPPSLAGRLPDPQAVRTQVEQRVTKIKPVSTSQDLPLSADSKLSIAYAAEEAHLLGHLPITPEHLALGILRLERSFASQLLRQNGLTPESLRKAIGTPRP